MFFLRLPLLVDIVHINCSFFFLFRFLNGSRYRAIMNINRFLGVHPVVPTRSGNVLLAALQRRRRPVSIHKPVHGEKPTLESLPSIISDILAIFSTMGARTTQC